MPDSGYDLGVDIYRLWLAGNDYLPAAAGQYAQASTALASTENGTEAFRRTDRVGAGVYGPVYPVWAALRDEMYRILHDTAENLELTGDALCLAAREYAKTDARAADEFERRRRGLGGQGVPR